MGKLINIEDARQRKQNGSLSATTGNGDDLMGNLIDSWEHATGLIDTIGDHIFMEIPNELKITDSYAALSGMLMTMLDWQEANRPLLKTNDMEIYFAGDLDNKIEILNAAHKAGLTLGHDLTPYLNKQAKILSFK